MLASRERPRYESDVCFAGDWGPPREEWIGRLMQRYRVRVWGPWGKKLPRDSRIREVLTDGYFTPEEFSILFQVPDEVVCFDSFEECVRLMDSLLADPDLRQQMGARASRRVHRGHTYEHRMAELLESAMRGARG